MLNRERLSETRNHHKSEYYHSRVCVLSFPEGDVPLHIVAVNVSNDKTIVLYPGGGISVHTESIKVAF